MSGDVTVPVMRRRGAGLDALAIEEPLEIEVEGHPVAALMRTPGDDLDLVMGFLHTEGFVELPDDIAALAHCQDQRRRHRENRVKVRLAPGAPDIASRLEAARRALYGSSSCGLCGKVSIEQIFERVSPMPKTPAPDLKDVVLLPERLRGEQALFARTGGVHGAALIDASGRWRGVKEDVGRHNAVDKIIGSVLAADGERPEGSTLVVSGRVGFEIVQKAALARVAVLVAVGAATSLARQLAEEAHLHLFTWVRQGEGMYHPFDT
ncbi:MAG: formate dehydrogenase accessory sulfurtransferase FdhD [Bradymonadia bacterium]